MEGRGSSERVKEAVMGTREEEAPTLYEVDDGSSLAPLDPESESTPGHAPRTLLTEWSVRAHTFDL